MIPTFFGATFLVFIILQMSPGGPLEKTIQQIQRGGAQSGEGDDLRSGKETSPTG